MGYVDGNQATDITYLIGSDGRASDSEPNVAASGRGEATVSCQERDVESPRKDDVLGVVCLGPAELLGQVKSLEDKVTRRHGRDRSSEETIECQPLLIGEEFTAVRELADARR